MMSDSNLENAEFYEDEFMGVPLDQIGLATANISEVVAGSETEGFWRIEIGAEFREEFENSGLFGLLAIYTAAVTMGADTKNSILDHVQAAAPKISRKFARELLSLLTGDNPERHLFKKRLDGTYQLMVHALQDQQRG